MVQNDGLRQPRRPGRKEQERHIRLGGFLIRRQRSGVRATAGKHPRRSDIGPHCPDRRAVGQRRFDHRRQRRIGQNNRRIDPAGLAEACNLIRLQAKIQQGRNGIQAHQRQNRDTVFPHCRQHRCDPRTLADAVRRKPCGHGIHLRDQFGIGQTAIGLVIHNGRVVRRSLRGDPEQFISGMHSIPRISGDVFTDRTMNPDLPTARILRTAGRECLSFHENFERRPNTERFPFRRDIALIAILLARINPALVFRPADIEQM